MTGSALDGELDPSEVSRPVREPSAIPVLKPKLPTADDILPYLRRIDATRIYANNGPLNQEFSARLAGWLGLPERGFVTANSGTSALVGAILAVAGPAKPERPFCMLPSFTFPATALAAEQCGYRPYLVDIDADSWAISAKALRRHPRLAETGVIIPVAPFGRAVAQAPWRSFRNETGVPVVIDGAASLEDLVRAPADFVGSVPVMVSFHATKSFGIGEGGGVAVADAPIADAVDRALNFGFGGRRSCEEPSINGKLNEYQAAVGLAELEGWPRKSSLLAEVARNYREAFAVRGLAVRLAVAPAIAGCYAIFRCRTMPEATRVATGLKQALIDYRHWYGTGLHRQGHFAASARDELANTDAVAPLLIGLPFGPTLGAAEIDRVSAAVAEAVDEE